MKENSLESLNKSGKRPTSADGLDERQRPVGERCRASSACSFLSQDYCRFPNHSQRICKSNCSVFCGRTCESDFHKVKRSLRLLGFELSELGLTSSREEPSPKWKPKRKSATLSTRVARRSVSLDSLRAAVRMARSDDRLDDSHRRLLSQAAYEEWYFTKERQIWEKREEERLQRLKEKISLRDDFQRKKEKSEEEFRKWLQGKKTKKKKQNKEAEKQENTRTITKEKSEKAFQEWKKSKEKELARKKTERRKEEQKKIESEKQKTERKVIAEKAFQQWKTKLEESERSKNKKKGIKKRKEEMEERMKRAKGSEISFQMWKEAKDEQIKQKVKECREAERRAREERFTQMEERMYEAEQAFEDWLEQIDMRKQKQFYPVNTYQKPVPWIPA